MSEQWVCVVGIMGCWTSGYLSSLVGIMGGRNKVPPIGGKSSQRHCLSQEYRYSWLNIPLQVKVAQFNYDLSSKVSEYLL